MVLGVMLAGAPLLAFDYWISRLIERDNAGEAMMAARRAISLSEARVGQVIAALDALAKAGVNSCAAEHLTAMRRAAFATTPIKEIALLNPDGQFACEQSGNPAGTRKLLSSEPLPGAPDYTIHMVTFGSNEQMVCLRRQLDGDKVLAAMVPSELFLPQVAARGGGSDTHARIVTAGGAVISESGRPPPSEQDAAATAQRRSDKYGLLVTTSLPANAANHSDLEGLSVFIKAAVAFILVGFALLLPRRDSNNPVAELERALAAGELIPYYQPIVDIRSGQLRGAEVLVRWRKADGSLVLPASFIPLAESSGLIWPMTRDLMRKVCAEAGAAIGGRPGLKISFNFAAQLFRDESIVRDVRNIFVGTPIDLTQVVIELTERDPIDNLTETRRVIAALQGIGVRIAIDDVGTGHSGLSYMLKLGVDIIKIDKMFVDAIGTDRNSTTIVETLIDLAHNMRMDVVAEGVENFEQVMHLRELGIRSAQGYVFAPPLPGGAFLQLVDAIDPLPAASMEGKVAGAARRYMSARSRFGTA